MEVYIDPASCDGHAACTRIAPKLFKIGSDGKSQLVVDTISREDEALALEAERSCPAAAIVALPDDDGSG